MTAANLANAHRVVSLGCDLNDLPQTDVPVDRWDDVPPASRDLVAAQGAIQRHVDVLIEEVAGETPQSSATV